MSHALIIHDNRAIGRGIQNRLQKFGFDSCDQVWSERQALEAAGRQMPDLIVVGETIAGGSPLPVASRISHDSDVPVLAITANGFMPASSLTAGTACQRRLQFDKLSLELNHALVA